MRIRTHVGLSILFLFIVANSAFAEKTIRVGLKSGISTSSFYTSSDNHIEFDGRLGMSIGGFLDFKLLEVINFQTELNYSQRGSSITLYPNIEENPLSNVLNQAKWKTSYVEVPLLFRVKFPYKVKFVPHMLFGPSLNFLSSTKVTNSHNIVDNASTIEKFDLATVFGVGTSFKWTYPGEIFFDVRYILGTTNVHEFFGVVLKNEILSLNLGYRF